MIRRMQSETILFLSLKIKLRTTALKFILNEQEVSPHPSEAETVLDYIRQVKQLKGTKIGCREGDCGACTVLVGEIINGQLRYRSMTSCLMPLTNANGKHILTIEGVNFPDKLNVVQEAMAECGATQCGFCTPGFVMSLTGYCLSEQAASEANAIAAIDGNICRCTGYKSIERAALQVNEKLKGREDAVSHLIQQQMLPAYLGEIKNRLTAIQPSLKTENSSNKPKGSFVSGGTDLYVQRHGEMGHENDFLFDQPQLNYLRQEGNTCHLGPAVTITDLRESEIINNGFPGFQRFSKLVSSTPIRNMATVAGNFVNASPIGDFSIFFLSLNAELELTQSGSNHQRKLLLRDFYKGYKQLNKTADEFISNISFELPGKNSYFNFEKVSKRTHLDIASVNSALLLELNGDEIIRAGLSAGGVGPVPLYLKNTSEFLAGKKMTDAVVEEALLMMKQEISPISDARGSKEYKTLLLGQLIKAHFQGLMKKS